MARKKSVRTPKKQGDKRGTNPNSLANLKPPWQPGDPSPNPSGRPKLLGESYRDWLAKLNASGITNAEAVALAMGIEALKGDVSAAREIRAATEGDHLELTGKDGAGLVIRVVYDEKPIDGTDDSPAQTAR